MELSVGEDSEDGGLLGDSNTRVGNILGGGELNSAASSWSRGTGDSVGDGLLTGEEL